MKSTTRQELKVKIHQHILTVELSHVVSGKTVPNAWKCDVLGTMHKLSMLVGWLVSV